MVTVKNVTGYEGLYLIDSLGNVVSLPKIKGRFLQGGYHVLSTKINCMGYHEVSLAKNGKMRTFLLHRLLAQHFVPNPEGLPCVNHKNGIKTDNRLENLEWVTHRQNTVHAFQHNLSGFRDSATERIMRYNAIHGYCKVVLSKNGKEYSFSSSSDAANFLGTDKDNITRAIRKKQRTRGWIVIGVKPDVTGGETSAINASE